MKYEYYILEQSEWFRSFFFVLYECFLFLNKNVWYAGNSVILSECEWNSAQTNCNENSVLFCRDLMSSQPWIDNTIPLSSVAQIFKSKTEIQYWEIKTKLTFHWSTTNHWLVCLFSFFEKSASFEHNSGITRTRSHQSVQICEFFSACPTINYEEIFFLCALCVDLSNLTLIRLSYEW